MTKPKPAFKPIVEFLTTCRKKTITLYLTCYKTGIKEKSALKVMRRLTKEGYLELIDEGRIYTGHKSGVHKKNPTWKIIDRKKIPEALQKKKKKNIRDRIWKAIRIKKIFNIREIMELALAKESTVMNYIKILERNKYARKAGKRGHREGGHWQLIINDGPARPPLKEYPEATND